MTGVVTDEQDVQVTHDMITKLYQQYKEDHVTALTHASKIQRELSRAEHETGRIERHLQRIEAFCKANNLSLEEGN